MKSRANKKSVHAVVLAAGPNGLGAVRSLWLRGVHAIAVTLSQQDVVNQSRLPVAKHVIQSSDPATQKKEILDFLSSLDNTPVVIATSDWFVSFLIEHETVLRSICKFVTPQSDTTELLIDKAMETSRIGSVIPIPRTLTKMRDAETTLSTLKLPIIVKPRSHKHMVLGRKNIILESRASVQDFFNEFENLLDNLIAQEIVAGDDSEQWVCNCLFDNNSELVQAFTFNRLRLSPSHYGVTSYAVSKTNMEVIDLTKKLGRELGYVGTAMVEYKRDPIDNIYKYIELNPRLGMCNFFDTACGINNAYAVFQLSTTGKAEKVFRQRDDVMFLSVYEDIYSRVTDGEKPLEILRDYLSNVRKKHIFIYFVWWDPVPAAAQLLRQFKVMVRRLPIFNPR